MKGRPYPGALFSFMRLLAGVVCLSLAIAAVCGAQVPDAAAFWNTTGRFAGSMQCAGCHPKETEKFRHSSMAHALEPVETCQILKGNVRLTFRLAPHTYTIARSGARVNYQVSDGKDTLEFPLEYAFGQGKAGQTQVFSAGGKYYASRFS
jgi:hypothetical protein